MVLSADKPWRIDLLPPEATHDEMVTFQDWLTALDRLAVDLDADHVTATNSGHDIEAYNPALVVDAIRTVVDDVRLHAHDNDRLTRSRIKNPRRTTMSRPCFGSLIVVGLAGRLERQLRHDARSTTTPAATTADVAATDTISPLIITALRPNPTPFKGTDDLFHVAYESDRAQLLAGTVDDHGRRHRGSDGTGSHRSASTTSPSG